MVYTASYWLLYVAYLIMEPVHVLLGVESPLNVVVWEGQGDRVTRVLEGEEKWVWRSVGSREGGTRGRAVPVLWAVAIALSCERMGLSRTLTKQQTGVKLVYLQWYQSTLNWGMFLCFFSHFFKKLECTKPKFTLLKIKPKLFLKFENLFFRNKFRQES